MADQAPTSVKHELKSHNKTQTNQQLQHDQAQPPKGNQTIRTILPTTLIKLSSSILHHLASLTNIHIPLDHPIWALLEKHVYALPNPPPPRTRPPNKPMQVLCVGLPRSGTESLQQALLTLGYDHTYHGWDIVYDDEVHSPSWVKIARMKWYPDIVTLSHSPKSVRITAKEFDSVLGHSQAVTDAAASCFAREIIEAYPDAKVILNMRRDVEGWHKSVVGTLVKANQSWGFWIASWLDRECFWAWHVYERFLWTGLFRASDGDLKKAVERNGRGVYYEHHAMIRGLVPKERLLEWYIDDGWEPLCRFLGKPVPPPNVPFPHANAANGGWKTREEQCNKRWVDQAFLNLIMGVLGVILVAFGGRWWLG
ncbi:P-loop containing nucleoside triphosphate hydrolase protein, partial [Rhypophila decipiens]